MGNNMIEFPCTQEMYDKAKAALSTPRAMKSFADKGNNTGSFATNTYKGGSLEADYSWDGNTLRVHVTHKHGSYMFLGDDTFHTEMEKLLFPPTGDV